MKGKSLLVKGEIPAHTECPFISKCGVRQDGLCGHQGLSHKVGYTCSIAKAHDLRQSLKRG